MTTSGILILWNCLNVIVLRIIASSKGKTVAFSIKEVMLFNSSSVNWSQPNHSIRVITEMKGKILSKKTTPFSGRVSLK